MSAPAAARREAGTEAVIRAHLQAFVERRGVAALLADYREDAIVCSAADAFRGKREIGEFFAGFLAGLPAGAIERFELVHMQVHGAVGYITWRSGPDGPRGTDTFVVEGGKIATQTVALFEPRGGGPR